MNILYNDTKTKSIAYNILKTQKKKAPYVVFHHGLMSDMNGAKAMYIENHCKNQGYNFIRFDNFGHGDASGEFTDQNITSWLEGLSLVIDELTDGPVLLVGSSMGAWITTLRTMKKDSKNIIGMVLISGAPDFTEELIWNQITTTQQDELKKDGISKITGTDPNSNHTYPISFSLIEDGRKHLILNKKQIEINCPVHLIHGMCDIDVPYNISYQIAKKLTAEHVIIKLIKNTNHSIYKPEELNVICNSIDEIIAAG